MKLSTTQARSHVVKGGAVRKGEGRYGAQSALKIFWPRPFSVYDMPIFGILPIFKLLLIVNKTIINAGYPVGVVFQWKVIRLKPYQPTWWLRPCNIQELKSQNLHVDFHIKWQFVYYGLFTGNGSLYIILAFESISNEPCYRARGINVYWQAINSITKCKNAIAQVMHNS